MQVKTILNRLQKHRGFVYGTVQLEEQIAGLALTVEIAPHRRNRPRCASCGQASAVYDRLALRRFEFVPLWGLRVFFLYPMRRVDCPRCGVTVERVPWADGKHQLTTTYMWFLARWAKCLSWQEVARVFRTSWDQVFRSVAMAVAWGRDHVDLTGIRAIGIDEIHWQRGSQFLTLVYQIDPTRKRLLWIGQHRRAKTLLRFFRWFGRERTAALAFICSDMWKAYLKVVAKKAGHALHILDRFHIAKHMSDAIDQVRRAEVRSLRQRGRQPLLTKARWVLLKRKENQTPAQRARLRELLQHNLPGFPFCLPRMAPYTPEGPPSARNSCRRTFVQLQRPSPQPALTCDRLAPLLSGHFSDTAPHVCRFFARRASLHSARASACRRR